MRVSDVQATRKSSFLLSSHHASHCRPYARPIFPSPISQMPPRTRKKFKPVLRV
ncbi:hypothetical protein NEOLEDRAFT_1143997 [Neolentinus lepideus HHB14362 ss-1]|uniref:Uncharacterized protein n=1 Tax=Neolentinus lepideus HHB14362 ss-1 TaxID=1314782 RepID=A0A165M5S0_9AGAM|nr:hypothetical protein NEOLEDRAFT_1144009 [Neolentinus lepideus HHB14362 ss-1]KZT17936.1 hypothetical protein NEOLEDRAFT_1143997 [Neolentinus lepideus HHB14362 ss-1]